MMQCSVLVGANGRKFFQLGQGNDATMLGDDVTLRQRCVLRQIHLVQGKPGAPGIQSAAAIFERWNPAGHVWVCTSALSTSLELPEGVGHWKWWQNKRTAISCMSTKFDLGNLAFRPSMPFKDADRETYPDRCLPYCSISVGSLLLVSLRCSTAASNRSGGLNNEGGASAFRMLFKGMMEYMPQDLPFCSSLRGVTRSVFMFATLIFYLSGRTSDKR